MLGGLRTLAHQVDDLVAARDWYTKLLGYGPYFDMPFYVGFDVGGYELGLQPAGDDTDPPSSRSSALWAVDDVQHGYDRALALGAKPNSPPRDVGDAIVVATVVDPFGNVIGLIRNPHFRAEVGARVAASGDLGDHSVVVETTLAASVDTCWSAWTTTEGMAEWWVENCRIELRVGGPFELLFMMDSEPGLQGSEGCKVLSYIPKRMFSFTWNAPPHLATRNHHTWCVLEFTPVPTGTHVRLTHTGWPSEADDESTDWPKTIAYFEAAWAAVLDRFTEQIGA